MRTISLIFFAFIAAQALGTAEASCPLRVLIQAASIYEQVFNQAKAPVSFETLPVSPATLYAAHRTGYLPERGGIWELPSTRGMNALRGRNISADRQTLRRVLETYPDAQIFFNRDPDGVIEGCASMKRDSDPWLEGKIKEGYKELAKLGIVFTAELWVGQQRVAGNFGLITGKHVQCVSKYRDLNHPISNGGGVLLTEAQYHYFWQRGIDAVDEEVAKIKGSDKFKQGVDAVPLEDFNRWRAHTNTQTAVVFEGASVAKPLPVIESDFRPVFADMRQSRNYSYER